MCAYVLQCVRACVCVCVCVCVMAARMVGLYRDVTDVTDVTSAVHQEQVSKCLCV